MDIHNRSLYLQYLLINICETSSKIIHINEILEIL